MTDVVKKTRGRPKLFDNDAMLEKALALFWERGYEGTSMAELTATLGINKPSLYAAFGNKEALFQQALARYVAGPVSFIRQALLQPTAKQVAETFLLDAAAFLTNHQHPKGCMIVQGALACGEAGQLIKELLIGYRTHYERLLTDRFVLAQQAGDLPATHSAQDLAKYLATLHQGMSVQAINGSTYEALKAMIQIALHNWPSQ